MARNVQQLTLLVLKGTTKEKIIIASHSHRNVDHQQFGMEKTARIPITNVLMEPFLTEQFVCPMFLVKMGKFGVYHTYIVCVLMEQNQTEMSVYLVQTERFGYLGKDVNVKKVNLTLVQAAKLLTSISVKIFQIPFGKTIDVFVSRASIQKD